MNESDAKPDQVVSQLCGELEDGVEILEAQTSFWLRRTEAELGVLMLRNQTRANLTFDPLFLHED